MTIMEDLQFSPRGQVREDIEAGTFTLEDAGSRWYLYLTLGYGRKVWVDSNTPFTLRQVAE